MAIHLVRMDPLHSLARCTLWPVTFVSERPQQALAVAVVVVVVVGGGGGRGGRESEKARQIVGDSGGGGEGGEDGEGGSGGGGGGGGGWAMAPWIRPHEHFVSRLKFVPDT